MDLGAGAVTHGEAFDQRPPKRPRLDDAGPWADIQPDMLRLVLRSLPCLPDRARVRSVCRHWRAVARSHEGVAPPLPLLMLPKFRFSSLCPDGAALTAARRLRLPEEADDVRWVGSFQGWLVGVRPSKYCKEADGRCFLLNAFSHETAHLPHLSAFNFFNYSGHTTRSILPIINGSGVLHCHVSAREYSMSFDNVALSGPPDSGSNCIVAASTRMGTTKLALWRHGMRSWCVCGGDGLFGAIDLAFYQGKLYMLLRGGSTPRLFAFEIEEDDRGIMVSRVERCMTEPLGSVERLGQGFNLVEWRGKLLVINRSPSDEHNIREVKVFSLDLSTNPCGLHQMQSLDGECIFVDSCSSRSFPADLHDGVQGDLIYFLDNQDYYTGPSYDAFVYNMRDGSVTPFAVELSTGNFGAPEDYLAHPIWFFPSK